MDQLAAKLEATQNRHRLQKARDQWTAARAVIDGFIAQVASIPGLPLTQGDTPKYVVNPDALVAASNGLDLEVATSAKFLCNPKAWEDERPWVTRWLGMLSGLDVEWDPSARKFYLSAPRPTINVACTTLCLTALPADTEEVPSGGKEVFRERNVPVITRRENNLRPCKISSEPLAYAVAVEPASVPVVTKDNSGLGAGNEPVPRPKPLAVAVEPASVPVVSKDGSEPASEPVASKDGSEPADAPPAEPVPGPEHSEVLPTDSEE